MAENTIKTRIVLRNDEQSAWNTSTKPLLKGEVAVSYVGDGKAELRFGQTDSLSAYKDGVKLQISADQVVGLNDTITALSTTHYETTDIATLSGTYVNGDTAVEIKTIADDKQSYTAYVYDKKVGAWKAMDGNYRADNVYFDENIELAGSYTQVGNVKLSDGVLSAKGMTVETLMNKIFDQTIQPTLGATPTAAITLSNAGKKEVGTEITPSWSVSYTQGKYDQSWNGTSVNDGTTATAYAITDGTSNSTASSGSFTKFTVLSSTSYKITGTVTYSDGSVAVDNKGKTSSPEVKRTADTVTATQSSTITGAFPAYYGFTTSPKANPTAITATDGNVTVDGVTYTRDTLGDFNKTTFTASSKWYELFYMQPAGKKASWTGKDGNKVDLAVEAKTTAVVTFKDGTTADYDVFVVRNAAAYSATTCTMVFK